MQLLANIPHKLYSPAKAEELAEMMNAGEEDDVTWIAVHDPKGTGQSFVEGREEDGYVVGRL